MPWCLRDSVVRSTLTRFATYQYENDVLGSRDLITSITASIRFILVELQRFGFEMIGIV